MAGVFGGAGSGVTESTTHVFAESANFDGAAVRRAAVALGLRTEASARNEKNLPVELPDIGRRAAARLLVAAGATPTAVADVGEAKRAPRTIQVRPGVREPRVRHRASRRADAFGHRTDRFHRLRR